MYTKKWRRKTVHFKPELKALLQLLRMNKMYFQMRWILLQLPDIFWVMIYYFMAFCEISELISQK